MTRSTRLSLGVLVRQKREDLRISMDDAAARARISRSTLHRIEHDHDVRPTAPKLAQILIVLGITPDEVRTVLEDERYLGDVLHWMERSAAFLDTREGLRPRAGLAALAGEGPALVAEKDGHHIRIHGDGLDEVTELFKNAGWLVMRPV